MSKNLKRLLWCYPVVIAAHGLVRLFQNGPSPQQNDIGIPPVAWLLLAGVAGLVVILAGLRKRA